MTGYRFLLIGAATFLVLTLVLLVGEWHLGLGVVTPDENAVWTGNVDRVLSRVLEPDEYYLWIPGELEPHELPVVSQTTTSPLDETENRGLLYCRSETCWTRVYRFVVTERANVILLFDRPIGSLTISTADAIHLDPRFEVTMMIALSGFGLFLRFTAYVWIDRNLLGPLAAIVKDREESEEKTAAESEPESYPSLTDDPGFLLFDE